MPALLGVSLLCIVIAFAITKVIDVRRAAESSLSSLENGSADTGLNGHRPALPAIVTPARRRVPADRGEGCSVGGGRFDSPGRTLPGAPCGSRAFLRR